MIETYVGPMHSGKSDALISIYSKMYNKNIVMAFKPKCDTRDGACIKSKNHVDVIPAIMIEDLGEVKKYVLNNNIHTVFIDEAQLLNGDVHELVDLSVLYDIDFYIGGLNMTSEQLPFGKMPEILAVSNKVHNIAGFCQDCNKQAEYTYYTGENKESQVLVGDSGYLSLCPACLAKRLKQQKIKIKKMGE